MRGRNGEPAELFMVVEGRATMARSYRENGPLSPMRPQIRRPKSKKRLDHRCPCIYLLRDILHGWEMRDRRIMTGVFYVTLESWLSKMRRNAHISLPHLS
ncbi:DNA repair protein [Coccidioides immitis RS]|uniref:DNA repair protein n=1 Tax=Coccidioides immitis (strain RS) TaxID=246410 RepID=J3K9K3_COCIM|nr:DNA repair protein [Coccidioides immitis RS]EAS31596.3 DNA repair protein [Coccidioides immitis RS]